MHVTGAGRCHKARKRGLELTDEELRKIAEEARQASVRPALWEPYRLYNALADGIEELLDRVEKAEQEAEEFRDGTTIAKLAVAEQALQRVRDRHQPCLSCLEPHCFVCEKAKWPCAEFRALEGDE